MAYHITQRDSLSGFISSYNNYNSGSGAGHAHIPVQDTIPIPGTVNQAQIITLRPTAGTAATLPSNLTVSDGTHTNATAGTLTYTRPLGGTGPALIERLRGLELVVHADEVTTAEVLAGIVDPRVTAGTITVIGNAEGEDKVFVSPFRVSAPGETAVISALPGSLFDNAESLAGIVIHFTAFARRSQIQLLTFAEDSH